MNQAEDPTVTPATPKRRTAENSTPVTLTPKTRQRKRYMASKITKSIRTLTKGLPKEDVVELVQLSLKQQELELKDMPKRKNDQKRLAFTKKEAIWNFWHSVQCTSDSSLTFRPAKLRISHRPAIQGSLPFHHAHKVIKQRGKSFFESQWKVTTETYVKLHRKYNAEHPNLAVSYGAFVQLRPFYVRSATTKDLHVCCCKTHLHAKWVVTSLIKLCEKQNIQCSFNDYNSFFKQLATDCKKDARTYVAWECSPNKATMCSHVAANWNQLSVEMLSRSDDDVFVCFQNLKKKQYIKKKDGETGERLELDSERANMTRLVEFINQILPATIHHRNQLRSYRNTVHEFKDNIDGVKIDVDFSEKLKVPAKNQAQSQHWNEKAVIVHSGILKEDAEKATMRTCRMMDFRIRCL